ncbi:hypothetical protein L6R53_27390 [Myxococcota bacterium]|nr:hypothetical protein [Myxococcota bacterium]
MPHALHDLESLVDPADPVGSEAALRAALAQAAAEGLCAELTVLTLVARCQGLQGRFDEALATLDAVESRANGCGPQVVVRVLLEDGRVLEGCGNPEAAAAFFEESFSRATEAGLVALAVEAAQALAAVLPPDPALEWRLQAIELAAGAAEPAARRWLRSLVPAAAQALRSRGEEDRARIVLARLGTQASDAPG